MYAELILCCIAYFLNAYLYATIISYKFSYKYYEVLRGSFIYNFQLYILRLGFVFFVLGFVFFVFFVFGFVLGFVGFVGFVFFVLGFGLVVRIRGWVLGLDLGMRRLTLSEEL